MRKLVKKEIEKHNNYITKSLFIVLTAISVYVMFYGRNSTQVSLAIDMAKNIKTGWYYKTQDNVPVEILSLPVKLPIEKNTSKAKIYRKIYSEQNNERYISFYTHHQNVWVSVDGKLIYKYVSDGLPKWISSYRSINHLIKIDSSLSGELCIETEALLKKSRGEFKEIYLGNSLQTLQSIFYAQRTVKAILGFILLVIGIVFLYISRQLLKHFSADKTIFHLSIILIFIGIWQVEESRVLQIFIGYMPFHWWAEYISQFFILVTSYLIIHDLSKDKHSIPIRIFFLVDVIGVILALVLQLTGKVQVVSSLPILQIIYLVACIYVIVLINLNTDFENTFSKMLFNVSIICGIAIFIIILLLKIPQEYIGILLICIAFSLMFLSFAIVVYQKTWVQLEETQKALLYKQLAFIDIATGTFNRTAWFELEEQFESSTSKYKDCCLIMFDMNNLKLLNDKYGHLTGDKVILAFCTCLKKVIGKSGDIYRVGGDEFICLCNNITEEEVKEILLKFDSEVQNQKETDLKFTSAYGYKMFNPTQKQDFEKARAEADAFMYKHKEEMKLGRK